MKGPRAIQSHHQIYGSIEHPDQELVYKIFKGEHDLLTKMNWRSKKTVSKGFLKCLLFFILRNEDRAINLENIVKE